MLYWWEVDVVIHFHTPSELVSPCSWELFFPLHMWQHIYFMFSIWAVLIGTFTGRTRLIERGMRCGWRDGTAVKNACGSFRWPELCSRHHPTLGHSPLVVTTTLDNLTSSSGSHRYLHAWTQYTNNKYFKNSFPCFFFPPSFLQY